MILMTKIFNIIILYYTTKNVFRESVVLCHNSYTRLHGQNGRAVYKKYGNHGDAQGAKRLVLAYFTLQKPYNILQYLHYHIVITNTVIRLVTQRSETVTSEVK